MNFQKLASVCIAKMNLTLYKTDAMIIFRWKIRQRKSCNSSATFVQQPGRQFCV